MKWDFDTALMATFWTVVLPGGAYIIYMIWSTR